jgi:GNAT superfamily N-acetyltransferase
MTRGVVRRASVADRADVFRLVEEYYEAVSVVQRDDRERLTQYVADPDCGAWLAFNDVGRAVGCVLYHPLPQLGAAGEMKRLYIQPASRRLGLAGWLVDELERFAGTRGDDWLYLDTKDDLVEAIRFYERKGYARCPRYNDNPQATIFMRKRLRSNGRSVVRESEGERRPDRPSGPAVHPFTAAASGLTACPSASPAPP